MTVPEGLWEEAARVCSAWLGHSPERERSAGPADLSRVLWPSAPLFLDQSHRQSLQMAPNAEPGLGEAVALRR